MKSFVIRYYYVAENKKYTSFDLKDIAYKYKLELISQNIPPDFLKYSDCIHMYEHSVNKLTIIAVALESEDSCNESAWARLKVIDSEFKEDIAGKMTVFFNNCSLEELFKKDEVVISLVDNNVEGHVKGELALLSWDSVCCESNFCYSALEETVASQMLSIDMPLLFGKLIYLHKLSWKLTERDIIIQRKKSDFEKQLINILNSKMTLSNDYLKDTEELEKDIEWMAVTFTKMIADQNLNRDGIKNLKTKLSLLESHIKQETNLINYLNIFDNMIDSLNEALSELESTDEELSLLREEYKAAIDVIQSRIQVINERSIRKLLEVNSDMQKKGIVYQYAASMIEFIVLAYYSHTLWTHLAHEAYTVIPTWIQLIVILLFSGNMVMVTHLIAEYKQGEKHGYKYLVASSITLAVIIIFILLGSALVGI